MGFTRINQGNATMSLDRRNLLLAGTGAAVTLRAPRALTAEHAVEATNALAQHISKRSDLFRTVVQPDKDRK
jgi:hypothetical protein